MTSKEEENGVLKYHYDAQELWIERWGASSVRVRELKEMGIELMVSIWPTVDSHSENYPEMLEKG